MGAQQEVFSLIAKLGGSHYKTVVDRTLCEFMGGLEGGIFLAQLLYWADKGDGAWFYKTYPEWKDETFLSEYQVRKIAKQCETMGFLETKLRKVAGAPTMHYRVDLALFTDSILKFLRIESEKSQNGNLKSEESIESEKFQEPYIDTKITTETTSNTTGGEGEGASAPPPPPKSAPDEPLRLPAPNRKNGELHWRSPHIDRKRFDPVTCRVRAGSATTAVEVYYERFDIRLDAQRLTSPMEDDLVNGCPDLDLLRAVIIAYDRANFRKPRNIKLILDWYREPSRFREAEFMTGSNGNGSRASPSANGRLSPAEKGMAAADKLRERLKANGKESILG